MPAMNLTRDEVIARSAALPSFPRTVVEILATVDDPDGNMNALVRCINLDPIIAARVLSVANMASARARRDSDVTDIYTATSLIGMSRVREIALISSMGHFVNSVVSDERSSILWQHSVGVGVCCQELAMRVTARFSVDAALIAGLLHDVGQFWLYGTDAKAYRACWSEAVQRKVGVDQVERENFGADHATIGAWLARDWGLPENICQAIEMHHAPDAALAEPLVPLVHVAEVLSHALELADGEGNRVTYVSSAACQTLGLVWDESIRPLFGRIEARSRHANAFFRVEHSVHGVK